MFSINGYSFFKKYPYISVESILTITLKCKNSTTKKLLETESKINGDSLRSDYNTSKPSKILSII